MKVRTKFNSEIARNSIYLDFEGEGKKKTSGSPLPHMAGLFRPNSNGNGGIYDAIFFKSAWQPAKNGSRGLAKTGDFKITIENLITEAKEKGAYIVFWSDYERNVIELNAPELLDSFESVSFNLLPPLRTIKNRKKIALDQELGKVLNQYLKAFTNRPLIESCQPGPAESCKRIDNFSKKHPKWKDWPTDKKQYLYDLLEYNKKDCCATWWLGKKLGNIIG